MPVFKLPEWRPDDPGIDSGFTDTMSGLMPGPNGTYVPLPTASAYSGAASGRVLGGLTVRKNDNANRIIVAGDGFIEELDPSDITNWIDLTPTAGLTVTAGDLVVLRRFKDQVVAVTGGNVPQKMNVSSGTQFADVGGTPPAGKYCGSINEHFVIAGIASTPNQMQWSAIGNLDGWTVGTNLSGTKTFAEGGHITGFVGGFADAVVFLENRIEKMVWTGSNPAFRFFPIAEDVGCVAPHSIVPVGRAVYFYSTRGWARLNVDSGGIDLIGHDRVDQYFEDSVEPASIKLTVGGSDPLGKRIWFTWYSQGSTSAYADKGMGYDWGRDRWFPADGLGASYIVAMGTAPYTLEQLDTLFGTNLDTDIPFSLDSSILAGNKPSLGLFNNADKLCFFTGAASAAQIDTQEMQLNPDGAATVKAVLPIGDTNAITVAIGCKALPGDSYAFTDDVAMASSTGKCNFSEESTNGIYHKARLKVPAATSYTRLRGIMQPEISAGGSV